MILRWWRIYKHARRFLCYRRRKDWLEVEHYYYMGGFLKNRKSRLERRAIKSALEKGDEENVPKKFTRGYET